MFLDDLRGDERDGRAPGGDHQYAPDGYDSPEPGARSELPPALDEIGPEPAAADRLGAGLGRGQPEQQQTQGAQPVRARVGREDDARRGERDEQAGDGRARELRHGLGDAYRAVRRLYVGGEARDGAGDAGLEEGGRRAVHRADHADLPEHHVPGEEHDRGEGLGDQAREVGADHQQSCAEPVREDTAEDDEPRETGHGGGHREADGARAVPVLEQARGERHRQHGVPQLGHGTRREEQPEVPRPDTAARPPRFTGTRIRAPTRQPNPAVASAHQDQDQDSTPSRIPGPFPLLPRPRGPSFDIPPMPARTLPGGAAAPAAPRPLPLPDHATRH